MELFLRNSICLRGMDTEIITFLLTLNENINTKCYLSQDLTNLMHKICFKISFISCLYMFRAHVLIIRRLKLHYTAFGIIRPTGGRLVHQTATCRYDNTRGCVMQF